MTDQSGRTEIDALVSAFFAVFDNREGRVPKLESLASLFAEGAVIAQDRGSGCEVYMVDNFAEPRIALLTSGALINFHEWETDAQTAIKGNVATRASRYQKQGLLESKLYAGTGSKFFQFGRFTNGWRITAIAWTDDPI